MTTNLLDTPAAIRACVFTLAGMPYAIDVQNTSTDVCAHRSSRFEFRPLDDVISQ